MPDRPSATGMAPRPNAKPRAAAAPPPAALDFAVVGIGASAGGLEACSRLLDVLPAAPGMAFILVQHLEPTHESLMATLLATHTKLTVLQAADGMAVQPDHFYIIPPAAYLTMEGGVLRVTPTPARGGARLPFDALLLSLAQACGAGATGVVLSGTGADGSLGLAALHQAGGFVIAQDPDEAEYDGMPRSAIATGAVDAILPLADIPAAILQHRAHAPTPEPGPKPAPKATSGAAAKAAASAGAALLADIIALLRARTTHDFTLYKPGTLKRRVERRMTMSGHDMPAYFALLQTDPAELEQLARDLLIHVTSFFRDPAVFDLLAAKILPALIASDPPDRSVRIWVAGCSTGEEAYSLAMIAQEALAAAGSSLKLQIFASDADADAVAAARDGLYPATIAGSVGPDRLRAFFTQEDNCYRVLPDLRAAVVFTVQDLLTDPPFSRIDLVSCRNVMIYLGPEAQRQVLALFHFALRRGGLLLLGNAEGVGAATDRFEVVSKPARLYRHIGRSRPGDLHFGRSAAAPVQAPPRGAGPGPVSRQAALADFCQRQVLDTHAPATVLINRAHECLYFLGPTERYVRMAPGYATLDLLTMVTGDLRTRLRSAILRSIQDNAPVSVSVGSSAGGPAFVIEVHPVRHDGEDLLLIYFVEHAAAATQAPAASPDSPRRASRVAGLERQLTAARAELQGAVRSLEIAADEQKAINENALSANEEFQSTNEELVASKEELQSLNEELTALNSQLQETLEQQRTTSNDLQNVLYSTDVATLFLDAELRIRFFTPTTKALFTIIRTDIGRPLADLHSLAADTTLASDAITVLKTMAPLEREIETPDGAWCRRILPYRTHDETVEGVVITFTDITQRRRAAAALQQSKRDADLANIAKSRFLAAASHDLRQPLQTLTLIQGLLANRLAGTPSAKLVARLDNTIGAMSGMLNTLLDINQIEAGIVQADIADFCIDDVLGRIARGFAYQAQAQGIGLRVEPCSVTVRSDPRLLEQMLRNLVSNAIKYTRIGRVLVGCRRQGDLLRLEVWDTGIGIADAELQPIFEEYHQVDNAARDRNRGLGLGLSIVQRLGVMLQHRVRVRSRQDHGSVFTIELPRAAQGALAAPTSIAQPGITQPDMTPPGITPSGAADPTRRTGRILVVEDDADLRDLLILILADGGYRAEAVQDGAAALAMAATMRPDLLLTDYNLPGGMDGLSVAEGLRHMLGESLPVIILTGDISTEALSVIASGRCLQLNKPVKPGELIQAVQERLPPATTAATRATRPHAPQADPDRQVIFVVDDDRHIRDAVRDVLEDDGRTVCDFASGEAFLAAYRPGSDGCLLIDAYLPGIGGLDLLRHLRAAGDPLPAIMITGSSDVPMAVDAMKAGAADFIEKPIAAADLLASLHSALERSSDNSKLIAWQDSAAEHIIGLTPRQRQIMDLVLAGHPSKNIAADLGISQRTVENHRASIMKTTGTRSLPALARLALAAAASMQFRPRQTEGEEKKAVLF